MKSVSDTATSSRARISSSSRPDDGGDPRSLLSLSIVLSLRPISHNTHRIARCHIVASESVQSLRDALNAAVEVEDYAEAQRLKERLDAAQLADAQADFDRAAPAAAVAPEIDATTPTSPTDVRGGGFAFDTAAAPASAGRPIVPPEDATFVFSASSATPRRGDSRRSGRQQRRVRN